ncbi:MAG TPA: YceI family protein [Nevskiaceae bacterium]|nr:YceI family protein [Nevskiaceae bacterium]
MKKLIAAAAGLLMLGPALAAETTYTIDPAHSLQTYRYRHLGLSFAQGRFNNTTGKITLDPAKKTGSADVSIDVNSLDTGVDKLDEHLKSADFFDAAKFPTITFKSTAFKFDGDRVSSVAGNLTIHGVTRPATLTVTNFACTTHPMKKVPACAANAMASIKRSDFGIAGYVPNVGDEIELNLEVEALADK